MRVGIAGAGKLGCALALGLKGKGFAISGVYSRSEVSAAFVAGKLGISFATSLKCVVLNSQLIFITVPDGEIARVASCIAREFEGSGLGGKVFLHCSGALTAKELEPLEALGACTGSFHPIQTFADRENGWKALEGIYFGFEGCEAAKKYARIIAEAFNGSMLEVKREGKAAYHAAAAVLSNYTVVLSYMAGRLFESIGVDPGIGVKALLPLLEKTVDNIKALGSAGALTGPVSRGDCAVVGKHVEALKGMHSEMLAAYKALGSIAAEIAVEKGTIDKHTAEKLKGLFD